MVAGAAGTAAMDLVWYVRYRRGGGDQGFWAWETAEGLDSWEKASAPGKVGKLIAERVLGHEPPANWARALTNLMHWVTGIGWGAQYGLVVGSKPVPPLVAGPVLGSVVWANGYVVLPVLKVYKPIWEYDVETLTKDWTAHLVYGTTAAAVFSAIS
jgi:hypothetical protein